jgi:hypothetical protein
MIVTDAAKEDIGHMLCGDSVDEHLEVKTLYWMAENMSDEDLVLDKAGHGFTITPEEHGEWSLFISFNPTGFNMNVAMVGTMVGGGMTVLHKHNMEYTKASGKEIAEWMVESVLEFTQPWYNTLTKPDFL